MAVTLRTSSLQPRPEPRPRIDAQLAATDRLLERNYPGDDGSRQPVHTVYVPADRFTPSLAADWGAQALATAEAHGGLERLGALLGQDAELAAAVASRVAAKLATRADRGPPAGLRGRLRGPGRRRRGRRRRCRRVRRGRRRRGRLRAAVHRDPLQVLRGRPPGPAACAPWTCSSPAWPPPANCPRAWS